MWVVSNYNIWTKPCFLTEPNQNSFRTESEFFKKPKPNWNKKNIPHIPTSNYWETTKVNEMKRMTKTETTSNGIDSWRRLKWGHQQRRAYQPDDLFFDADVDFFFGPDAAVEDAAAAAAAEGGGLSGFFALFPSFNDELSPLRLIVYGSSSELADVIPCTCQFIYKCTHWKAHINNN